MAKQPKKTKSFIEDMTEKLSAGYKRGMNALNSAPPIGTSGRYGSINPAPAKKAAGSRKAESVKR